MEIAAAVVFVWTAYNIARIIGAPIARVIESAIRAK